MELTIECARPGCLERFEKRSVRHRFCSEACRTWREDLGPAKPSVNRPAGPLPFVGIDGEGIGRGKDHRYVLLGVGQRQREWPDGVTDITEIFDFLYECFLDKPEAIYAGFYLGYDFNMWLKLLPRERAAMLLTAAGIGKRSRKSEMGSRLGPFPVEYRDWQFDMLGYKRFKLRPADRPNAKWMYVCDCGPFWQTSLMTAIDPKSWRDPIVTPEEYDILKTGKERRDSADLDDDMRMYNRLENDVFARAMGRLQDGFAHANVTLRKQQWFGPGQSAQAWMRLGNKLERTTKAVRKYRKSLLDAAIATYYGGWFELPVHGHVPGTTYEYDINSAYPFIASRLPCLCGAWKHGTGKPRIARSSDAQSIVICRAIVRGKDENLGPLPYRRDDGRVLRPRYTNGYYWLEEILAAKRAGLIDEITYLEYYEYWPCEHEPPLTQLNGLYESRLRIGKDTPEGKGFKLLYNSVYGKFAQSEGEPVFSNPFYASLITSGCRTLVLDAIAQHPDKSAAVVMVATDGVYFRSRNPALDAQISDRMGDWSREEKINLTVFKPGVYWDDKARAAIAEGQLPKFKSRGVSARDFASSIGDIDRQFSNWGQDWLPGMPPAEDDWPTVDFRAAFTQISVKQALQWTEGVAEPPKQIGIYRKLAGLVQEGKKLTQDSYPDTKRNPQSVRLDGDVWRTDPWDGGPHWPPSTPYDKRFGATDDDTGGFSGYDTPDGPAMMQFRQALGVG